MSLDGTRWISSRHAFLLAVRVLGELFRRLFLTRLLASFDAGRLGFLGAQAHLAARKAFLLRHLSPIRKKRWVVYAKPPFAGPHSASWIGSRRLPCARLPVQGRSPRLPPPGSLRIWQVHPTPRSSGAQGRAPRACVRGHFDWPFRRDGAVGPIVRRHRSDRQNLPRASRAKAPGQCGCRYPIGRSAMAANCPGSWVGCGIRPFADRAKHRERAFGYGRSAEQSAGWTLHFSLVPGRRHWLPADGGSLHTGAFRHSG
ncbi:hypothetical protein K3M67_19635 (plasmid) [Sphingobium sp. V4]|uniref:transposase n=1 Tax=Sphingobium sp. V4 TaxID=3038927 RepID=UPI002557E94B|nr:transposase [Sphingobium sp. V4]WIW91064.1 hypothetical protein K3M67_19635 [Sphingobium sp. V4]